MLKAEVTATVRRQRRIQKQLEAAENSHVKKGRAAGDKSAAIPQTRVLKVANELMPKQHFLKGELEASLQRAPEFLAPSYRGSGKLAGKVAIITGGDSGIGRAVAVLFAREGANVAIVYLNEHRDAKATAAHVVNEGQKCLLISGDVRDSSFCKAAVAKTVKHFGQLDILVNNAAFQQHTQSIDDLTELHFDETMKTNVYGYFHMVKAVMPHLKPGSAIINTGSETGLFGHGEIIDYAASKGAIHALTKSLASNLLPLGIRVNAVAPGPVWTPLNPADSSASEIAHFGKKTDMKRPAQPDEISPAYVFLASAACSSYITGIVLPIIGSVTG